MKPFNTTDNCNIEALVNETGSYRARPFGGLLTFVFKGDVRVENANHYYFHYNTPNNDKLTDMAAINGLIVKNTVYESNITFFTKHKEACETFPLGTPNVPLGALMNMDGHWVLPPKLELVNDKATPSYTGTEGTTTTGTYTVPARSLPIGTPLDTMGWILSGKPGYVNTDGHYVDPFGMIDRSSTYLFNYPAKNLNPKYYGTDGIGPNGYSTIGLGNKAECSCEYCTQVKELKVLIEEKMSRSDNPTALHSQLVAYLNTQP